MRSRTLISLLTVIPLLLVAVTLATRGIKASPGTRYVSTDGLCGGHAPCYTNVQDALDAATTGDEILVATGIYTDTDGTVAEIAKTITLQGGWNAGFTDRNPQAYPTLDAQGNGRVIQITGNISPTIDGFIITGGDATDEGVATWQGGGIHSWNADPIIANNVIINNIANTNIAKHGDGGGLHLFYASASTVISNNLILSNTASIGEGSGGGLFLLYSDATLSGNTISSNTAGTAPYSDGGGLYLNYANAILDGNRIISNTAYSVGGGLSVYRSAAFTLTNNIIAQNRANTLGGGLYVYGYASDVSSGTLVNNTFAQNNLGSGGEGVYATGATTLTLTNNIVVSHTWGIYADAGTIVTADYTLFFGNTSGELGSDGATITNTHEVSGDPLFVDPSAWDYHIQVASPAVNRGTFTGAPTTDFEGDPRPYGCVVDIGADENTDPVNDECKRVYLPLIMKNY